jgi:hypothetical protein
MSSSGITNEDWLLELAEKPATAARNWKRLSTEEKAFVKNGMLLRYGPKFAIEFTNAVNRHEFKATEICATGSNTLDWCGSSDPARIGYVVVQESSSLRVWMHPRGHQIWETPQGKGVPVQIPEPPPLPDRAIEQQRREDRVRGMISVAFDARDSIQTLRRQLALSLDEQKSQELRDELHELLSEWPAVMNRLKQEATDAFGENYARAGRVDRKRLQELGEWDPESSSQFGGFR